MIDQFLLFLQEQDLTDSTMQGYKTDLRQSSEWFAASAGKAFAPDVITPLDIREWRREMQAQKRKPGTVNRKLNSMRGRFGRRR